MTETLTHYSCTFTFHGDDRPDALQARITAALEAEDVDFDPQTVTVSRYRLLVNETSTVMIELWPSGTITMATRDHPSHTWGPPTMLAEEKVQ